MSRQIVMLVYSTLLFLVLVSAGGCVNGQRYFFSSGKVIAESPMEYGLSYEEVRFASRDGNQLQGWLIPGDPAIPPLLYFHGNGSNLSDCLGYIKLFHKLGFTVFVFDYRGYGKSAGMVYAENDLYNDARGAVSYLEHRGWRHERMIYYGQSLGGAVATQMALEAPPAGLVLESAFTSFPDMANLLAPVAYSLFGRFGQIDRLDNLAKIGDVTVPLLIAHGDRDALVPLDMSRKLFATAREPKTFYLMTGAGHCDAVDKGGEGYLAAWRTFLMTVRYRASRSG